MKGPVKWIGTALSVWIFLSFMAPGPQSSQAGKKMGLREAIRVALKNNIEVLKAREAVSEAKSRRRSALADFFPKLAVSGSYGWLSETPMVTQRGTPALPVYAPPPAPAGTLIGFVPPVPPTEVPVGKQEPWAVQGTVTQPIFTGGALWNSYQLAKIGEESSRVTLERIKQDISMSVVQAYFNVLNTMELKRVADQAVKLLESQREVAQEFYQVGMIPKNDLLKTEVQLAERVREQTDAENAIELAKSRFNLVLQRPVETPVDLENILLYKPVPFDLKMAMEIAKRKRLELKELKLKIQSAKRQVRIAQSAYFPHFQIQYSYFRTEGRAFTALEEGWFVEATGQWSLWEWGKRHHEVAAAKSRLRRARYALAQLMDRIALEVKEAYLAMRAAERNIFVAKKAIEQAEENFRMNQERYKEQVGTITDVLDAQTLLTKAQTDYYNSLRNFNVAKAALRRAMGLPVVEP